MKIKLGFCEQIHNVDFNLVKFDQIKTKYGKNSLAMSQGQQIKSKKAIEIVFKKGRYSIEIYAYPPYTAFNINNKFLKNGIQENIQENQHIYIKLYNIFNIRRYLK